MTMLLFSQLLPLAADLLEVILPIIFMILYAVSQLLTAKKEGRPPKLEVPLPEGPQKEFDRQGGLDRQGGRDRAAGNDADQPGGLKGALRKEVDEFLRRAQGNRDLHEERGKPLDDQPSRSQSRPSRHARSSSGSHKTLRRESNRRESSSPPRNLSKRLPTKPSLTEEISKEEDRLTPPPATFARRNATTRSFSGTQGNRLASDLRSQSVPAHVAAHIGQSSQAIGQHAERLGDTLESTSEQTQHRIEQKFDHRLGNLLHQEEAAAVQEPGLAEEVANLLHSPEGMRQLIIANEILNRPEY